MPFHQDFGELYGKSEMTAKPYGWIPLTIEYGYKDIARQKNFFWRVKGTQHTFRIPLASLNEFSHGNYEHHIEYVLENFRQEYLSWAAQGFSADWMVEYHQEYRNYLEI
jgi:hypothetical protein